MASFSLSFFPSPPLPSLSPLLLSIPPSLPPVLDYLGCCKKNTIDWVAYKQQKFISYGSGDWQIWNRGAGRFDVWWGLVSDSQVVSSPRVLTWRKGWESPLGCFYEDTKPILGALPSWPRHLKVPPTNTLEVRFQHINFGMTNIQSIPSFFPSLPSIHPFMLLSTIIQYLYHLVMPEAE